MFNIKKIVFYSLFILILQPNPFCYGKKDDKKNDSSQNKSQDTPVDKKDGHGKDLGKHFGADWIPTANRVVNITEGALIGTAVAVTTRYVVRNGIAFAKWVKPDKFETEEEKLLRKKTIREAKIMELEEKLANSLIKHAFEEKNKMGIPCACEEDANNYAEVAGVKALAQVVEQFKEALIVFNSKKRMI
jgi:hypothetical protein